MTARRHGPSAADFPALARFLDGYLHQDFREEYGSAVGAAAAFTREAGFEERAAAAADLRAVRRHMGGLAGDGWRRVLPRVGGAWSPAALAQVDDVLDVLESSID